MASESRIATSKQVRYSLTSYREKLKGEKKGREGEKSFVLTHRNPVIPELSNAQQHQTETLTKTVFVVAFVCVCVHKGKCNHLLTNLSSLVS